MKRLLKYLAGLGLILGGTISMMAAPVNNAFGNATVIPSTSSNTVYGYNSGQGVNKQDGEPNHAGNQGGRSVWWVWTASGSGSVTVNTEGSSFDTLLGVYTGNSVSSLTTIASDDNSGSGSLSLLTFNAVSNTVYHIAVDGKTSGGGRGGSSTANGNITLTVFQANVTPSIPPVSLVATGSVWKYLDNGSDQGTAWRASAFDDSSWASGAGELGYGDADEATVVGYGGNANNVYITTYFRHAFYVTNAAAYSNLVLNLKRDDGAVVYLNGTEIVRDRLTNGATIHYLTLATNDTDDGATFYSFNISTASLVSGSNYLAVEIHQSGVTSSDISFDLSLSGIPGGYIDPTNNYVTLSTNDWKFLDDGSNLGTNWIPLAFDDSAWDHGPAELGYGDGDEVTVVNGVLPSGDRIITTYFRSYFQVSYTSIYTNVIVRLRRDDGAVVYLNGTEIIRDNLPGGAVDHLTLASTTAADDGTNVFEFNVSASLLVNGTNIIAVEIHQFATNSTDISFALDLIGDDGGFVNLPPVVNLTQPADNTAFSLTQTSSIPFLATATDSSGTVTKVEFYEDLDKLGEDATAPYAFTWSNLVAGDYIFRAVAVDSFGLRSTSAPVNISIVTNFAPTVSITNPADAAVFTSGTNITIDAVAADADGTVVKVEFFQGATKLGEDTTSPYSLVWSNVPVGGYILTAVATDNSGRTNVSTSVLIDVVPPSTTFWVAFNDHVPGGASSTSNRTSRWNILGTAPGRSGPLTNIATGAVLPVILSITNAGTGTGGTSAGPLETNSPLWTTFYRYVDFTNNNSTVQVSTNDVVIYTFTGLDPAKRYSFKGSGVRGNPAYTNRWTLITLGGADSFFSAQSTGIVTSLQVPGSLASNQVAANFGNNLNGDIVDWENIDPGPDGSFTVSSTMYLGLLPNGIYANTNNPPYGYAISGIRLEEYLGLGTVVYTSIVDPVDHQSFFVGDEIYIEAAASVTVGSITNVDFYRGTTKLGQATNSPYYVIWTNAPIGLYSLTSVAKDAAGNSRTSAPVNISVSSTNPTVRIISPTNGTIFLAPTNIAITTTTSEENGALTLVEFYRSVTKLGEDATAPYAFTWTNAPVGTFVLTAVSTDTNSVRFTSAPVSITITTNVFPTVSITSPANNASFAPGSSVTIDVTASDTDGSVTNVDFFDGTTKLASDTTAPFSFLYASPSSGSHPLKAVATDNRGATNTSTTVNFSIVAVNLTRGPYLLNGTTNGAIVRWCSDLASDGYVRYGTNSNDLNLGAADLTVRTNHTVQLANLQPNTAYYYSVGTSNTTIAARTNFFFITPPHIGTPQRTRMWVLGDAGTSGTISGDVGNAGQIAVRDAYNTYAATNGKADLILMLGDNAYNNGTDQEYQRGLFRVYTNNLCNTFTYACVGNHDTAQALTTNQNIPMFNWFTTPKNGEVGGVPSGDNRYYSYDHANIHFVVLDSMASDFALSNNRMLNWLTNDLADTLQPWIIVFFHHPPYTKGSHDSDTEGDLENIRENWTPILESYGVDLVLNGHSHVYERSYLIQGHTGLANTFTTNMVVAGGSGDPLGTGAYQKPTTDGTVYAVTGSAGQSGSITAMPVMSKQLGKLGSMVIDVLDNRLDAIFLTSTNTIEDRFAIIKPARPAAPTTLIATAVSTSQIQLGWTDTATNELGYLVERSTDGLNFTPLASLAANAAAYNNTGLPASTTYHYRVRATNDVGASDYSNIASAATFGPPVIVVNPASRTNTVGTTASFSVTADGASLAYQWRFNGTNLTGQTASTLALSNVQLSNAGPYTVHITNSFGSITSSIATLTVGDPAGIATAPTNLVVLNGQTAVFTVVAGGTPPYAYQWTKNNSNVGDATNASLSIVNAQDADEGDYRVQVSNAAGGALSSPATLTVLATNPLALLDAKQLSNGYFQMTLSGVAGQKYAVDRSFDLLNWTQWITFTNVTAQTQLTDTTATNANVRFYRGRLLLLP